MSIEWRPVVGYEDCYAVSDEGQIVRTATYGKNPKKCWKPVSAGRLKHGYVVFHLCKDGIRVDATGHRITWTAFFGDIPEGLQINHINSKRDDNRLGNLELMTPSENISYSFTHNGRQSVNGPGSKYRITKLNEADIPVIMQRHKGGDSFRSIAESFDVTPGCIMHVVQGKTWRHVSRHVG